MLTTDPYLTLYLHDQRGRRLREEAAAHALARRVRGADRTPGRSRWPLPRRRLRAPAIP
ncbi:MAG: hypothetical protein V7603_5820 [Micromonosporaceae bacterium]